MVRLGPAQQDLGGSRRSNCFKSCMVLFEEETIRKEIRRDMWAMRRGQRAVALRRSVSCRATERDSSWPKMDRAEFGERESEKKGSRGVLGPSPNIQDPKQWPARLLSNFGVRLPGVPAQITPHSR